jgi:hypothetical protein
MTTEKCAPARSKTAKKPLAQKARSLRGASHEDLRETIRDVKRTDWGGKEIGKSKRERKPAEMEMNRRYREHRQPVDHFHPENYSRGELEAIAAGRGGEAWTFTMHRNDVPQAARKMAKAEIARRGK